ncbi:universal stress protein [Nocardia abscessus]|uniref:universal stress protein n=1 Tax=Nocardia abscessus TaxID=120957 RepID=UPI0018947D57|nr:universal stress protein [Nocardia abscessus]MBF6221982.1 universal stress protein [Nocardia abscessus]
MTQQRYDLQPLVSAAVVLGVDGSRGSERALRWAAELASQRDRELRIVHGMDLAATSRTQGTVDWEALPVVEAAQARGRSVLRRAEQTAQGIAPTLRITTRLSASPSAQLLIEHSAGAYATVLGARGGTRFLRRMGRTLLAVTAYGRGIVVVVRADADADTAIRNSGPVVVGVDASPVSEAAIAAAFMEASERRTDLVAVHVWSDRDFGRFAGRDNLLLSDTDLDEAERAILAERLAGWQERYPDVPVGRRVYPDAPAELLETWSKSAQLVVVGNRGREGLRGLLFGSTCNALVRHSHCPVMVAHPADR